MEEQWIARIQNKLIICIKDNLFSISVVFFVIGILAPVIVTFFFNIPYPSFINNALKVDNIGSVGDFLSGTMTPFFTMAAFLMLIKSYFLQKEELEATREEMKASAAALEAQKNIMKEEAKLSSDKNALDIFFMLYNNWRELAKEEVFDVYYQVKVEKSIQNGKSINRYFLDGLSASDTKVNLSNYGKHLKGLLQDEEIKFFKKFESLPTVKYCSKHEDSLIIDNLKVNVIPIVKNFNNLLSYIKENKANEVNTRIMKNTVTSSINLGEKFVLNMIVSDFILGAITEEEQWRFELKENIRYLHIEMKNYDSHDEKFKKKHGDCER